MQSKNGYLINWKDLRNKVTVVIPIITLLILSYSVFIAGPNANRMTQNTLQQIVNNTQPQMPYLIGGAECKIFTMKNVKEYNFPLNNSNDYYADIFHLLVSGKSATSPRIKVRIPKADFRDIKREYIRTFPEQVEPRIESDSIGNIAVSVSWEVKVPPDETKYLIILYDQQYHDSLISKQRTYTYSSDDSITEYSRPLNCSGGWDYFNGFSS